MRKILIVVLLMTAGISCGKFSLKNENRKVSSVVSYISGKVTLQRNGSEEKAVVGMILTEKDTIVTGESSNADLFIKDYGILKVGEKATITLSKLSQAKAEVDLEQGVVVSLINRKDSSTDFNVITPTAIAGVRGTAFLTSVSSDQNNPVVKFAVLSGAVAVQSPGRDEVLLEKDLQIVIEGKKQITRDMIRPLSAASLQIMHRLAVLHGSSVLGFDTMAEDIRKSSPELKMLEGNVSIKGELNDREAKSVRSSESVEKAKQADISRHVKRDTEGDPLKLVPQAGFGR